MIRLTRRAAAAAAAIGAAIVVGLTPAHAAPPLAGAAPPSAAERAVFESCLADAASGGDAKACVARVADACIAKDGGETTVGIIACDGRETALWSARIAAIVSELTAHHSPAQAAALAAARAEFERWREAKCAYAASIAEGGSLARVVATRCRLETTAAWALDLARRLEDETAQ